MSRMPAELSIVVRFAELEPARREEMLRLMLMFLGLPDNEKPRTWNVLLNMHREMVERGIKVEKV